MKKSFLMLILAMSATALVGCGNQDNPPIDPNDPNAIKKVLSRAQ